MAELAWTDVESSNIKAVAFDEVTKTLCVRFHNGGLYSYPDIDHEFYVDLLHAESVGKYFNAVIKAIASTYTKWDDEATLISELMALRR